MVTSAFVAVPLMSQVGRPRTAPTFAAVAQRPPVLARPPRDAQQLSLFGPPGGRR